MQRPEDMPEDMTARLAARISKRMTATALLLAGGLALALLGGCRSTVSLRDEVPPPAPPPVAQPKPLPVPEPPPPALVEYVGKARAMPGADLFSETQKQLDAGDARSRLRAAIALAQPQHPARDEARAVALAEEVARAPETAPPMRDLAAMLALWLDEQRRAEANQRRAQTQSREDAARLQLLETRLRDMERRAQDAEKKLDALRAIERDLSGRGGAGTGSGAGAGNGGRPQ